MNKFTRAYSAAILLFLAVGFEISAQSPAPGKPFTEQPATLETPAGILYGTLLLPDTKPTYPVVLFISGSGPTDRNGNSPLLSGPNNSLKMLAEYLAANGIASLRYDKRGAGEGAKIMGGEANLRFDTYINDAVLWSKQLRRDKRFSTLTIVGHSEGSLIGMIAAQGNNADGYVSLAGFGRPAGQVILDQLRPQLPPDLMKTSEEIVASLTAGKTYEPVPPQLNILFRPDIQPYLISWFSRDPSRELAKLAVPVLIAQGTTDIQVSVAEAKLLAKAAPDASLLMVEGMNHVLKPVPDDKDRQIKSYSDPSLQIAPQLAAEMVKFVKKIKTQRLRS